MTMIHSYQNCFILHEAFSHFKWQFEDPFCRGKLSFVVSFVVFIHTDTAMLPILETWGFTLVNLAAWWNECSGAICKDFFVLTGIKFHHSVRFSILQKVLWIQECWEYFYLENLWGESIQCLFSQKRKKRSSNSVSI